MARALQEGLESTLPAHGGTPVCSHMGIGLQVVNVAGGRGCPSNPAIVTHRNRHMNTYRRLGWPAYERALLITCLLAIHKHGTLTSVTLETRVPAAHSQV